VFVDVGVAMHSPRIEENWIGLGQEFIRIVCLMEGRDASGKRFTEAVRSGLFRSEYPVMRSELLYTSVLASKLGKIVPRLVDKEAHCLHQVTERSGGKMDICVYLEEDVTWAPVCFFEFGMDCGPRQKYNHSLAHGVNLSPQLLSDHIGLDVEIILSATDHVDELGWMRVYGFRLVKGRKVGFANIWQGPLNAKSVSQLLSSIEIVARSSFAPFARSCGSRIRL
jgi:hypothetical protein